MVVVARNPHHAWPAVTRDHLTHLTTGRVISAYLQDALNNDEVVNLPKGVPMPCTYNTRVAGTQIELYDRFIEERMPIPSIDFAEEASLVRVQLQWRDRDIFHKNSLTPTGGPFGRKRWGQRSIGRYRLARCGQVHYTRVPVLIDTVSRIDMDTSCSGTSVRPLVGAIVVNWNGLSDTLECLASLKKQTYDNVKIVVVDNGSDGDDAARIREAYGDFVAVVRTERNLGCAGGFNVGIDYLLSKVHPDFYLLVNNDVTVAGDTVELLVEALTTHPGVGIVGPKIYYKDYNGRSDVLWRAGGTISRWSLKVHRPIGDGHNDCEEYNQEREVDWISGAVTLFTREALRDGGHLNTWYFIGYEDIEFCLKARAAGHRILYVPRARAWHEVGASVRKMHLSYADPGAYYYLIRRTFPTHAYVYHLALFPLLLARWGILFVARSRDAGQLRRFAGDLWGFVIGRRRNTGSDSRSDGSSTPG